MKPESKFRQTKVIPFLKTLKNSTHFSIQQASISGTPDILLCCNGLFIALELKSATGKASELQKYNLKNVDKCGGLGLLVNPGNWEQVKILLKLISNGDTDD